MALVDKVHLAHLLPAELLGGEHCNHLRSREGHKRLDSDGRIGRNLKSNIKNGLYTLRVGFHHLPRLGIGQILVTDAGKIHGILQRLAEVVVLDVALQLCLDLLQLRNGLLIIVGQLATSGNYTVIILLREDQGAVDEVTQDSHQLRVVTCLEVLPSEVVILRLGGICTQYVTKYILLSGELLQILMQPDGPVARGRNLVAFEVQELVRGDIFGQDVVAMRLQHRGEYDAVEDDIILTDEVDELRLLIFPILLPIGRKVLRGRDIANRSIEPYIEHLTLGTLNRHGNTPIQVAAHGTGLQTAIQPALALAIDIRFPLLVTLQNPVAKHLLVVVQGQIPVLGLLLHRLRTRHSTVRVNQLIGRKGRTTLLALVAIGTVVATLGAGTYNIAVGKEGLGLLVVVLLGGLLDELTLIVELAEELRSGLVVRRRGGTRIDIERDTQPLKRAFDKVVVTVHDILGRNALLAGLDGDGYAMLIRAANRNYVGTLQSQVARIDIRRHIDTCQVADMDRTIGIGKCRGNEVSFECFCHDSLI